MGCNMYRLCEVCHSNQLVTNHHIFYGSGDRKKSDKYDCCQIDLCIFCHERIHKHGDREFDLMLKKMAQQEFEEKYSREKFTNEFRRNYLGDDYESNEQ